VRGGPTAGLMGGTGGKESLNDLGLVPQSVLMVKWEDEAMNGESLSLLRVRKGGEEEAK
jgi:tether containing UBX domain for GLUT4